KAARRTGASSSRSSKRGPSRPVPHPPRRTSMLSHRRSLALVLALAPLLLASAASAQDATTNQVKKDATDIKAVEPTQQNGVIATLRGDLAFALTNTDKVVGQPDGL